MPEGQGLSAQERAAWRRLAWACLATLAVMLGLGLLLAVDTAGLTVDSLQAAERAADQAELVAETNRYPGWATAFFIGDTLFALSYGLLYVCMARAFGGGWLAWAGLAAGVVKAAADLLENSIHLHAAIEVLLGTPWTDPAMDLLLAAAQVKRTAGALAGIAFACVVPAALPGAWLIRLLLLAGGVLAVLGYFIPALSHAHSTLLFLTLPPLIWAARRYASRRHAG